MHDQQITPSRWLSYFCAMLCMFVGVVVGAEEEEGGEDAKTVQEAPITQEDREHWSFQPLVRPEVPEVENQSWCVNEVDRFILAGLEAEGLSPFLPAGRTTLIRRVTFDLTGLPPTPEEIDAFLKDTSPTAYEKLIERLLASPRYGERWAQHWLDLARFAETDGFEHDKVRAEAWKYRDWVISALNGDMPYQEFVRLQLAGDELRPDDPQAAAATGFCMAGPDMPDINLQAERRHTLLNELTGTVGAVFLGLQFACAECHDHKYDPISHADFYRLRSFFDHTNVFGKLDADRVLVNLKGTPEPSRVMLRGDFRRPGPELDFQYPRIANAKNEKPPEKAWETGVGRRTALADWITKPDHPLTGRVVMNRLWQFHFGKPLADAPSDFGIMGYEPTHPELLDWLATELPKQGWKLKPLHKMLVMSATYRQASRPDDAEWTAEQRQQAAKLWQTAKEVDRENQCWSRMQRQRLDGESIRDAMLACADRLSPRTGGPGVMPPLPEELVATLLKGQWKPSKDEEDHRRRSVYLFVRRNLRYPLFEVFDRPDTLASCPRRSHSTVTPQALLLLNSEFSLDRARDLAGHLLTLSPNESGDQISHAYRLTLGRLPTSREQKLAADFLTRQSELIQKGSRSAEEMALPKPFVEGVSQYEGAALVDFCLALFNLNEFVYVD